MEITILFFCKCVGTARIQEIPKADEYKNPGVSKQQFQIPGEGKRKGKAENIHPTRLLNPDGSAGIQIFSDFV